MLNEKIKLRVYIDTSVIGGYFDDEFSNDTKLLFNEILKGPYCDFRFD
jgi:hypothetical protein